MKRLSILFVVLVMLVAAQAVAAQDQLTLGVPVEGTLETESLSYTFSLDSASLVSIALNSEEFDPKVVLMDAGGATIGQDDDGGSYPNSLLIVNLDPGTYTVVVQDAFGYGTGAFVLNASVIEPVNLGYDSPATVDFAGSDPILLSFKGVAGIAVNLYADSGEADLDTALTLMSASGEELVTDDDGGLGWEPAIMRMILPEDGTYIVKLAPSYGNELFGSVQLTLEEAEILSLDDGPLSVTVGEKADVDVIRLTTELGSQYTVSLNGAGVTFNIDLEIGDLFDGNSASFDNVLGGSMTFGGTGDVVEIKVINNVYSDGMTTVELSAVSE